MLNGLDDIDWSALTHACGDASDVPGQLRAVAAGGEEAADAVYELCGNIYHQGSVYPATPYAVPFVAELAASRIGERVNMTVLLAEIGAAGAGPGSVREAVTAVAGPVLAQLASERDREMQAALVGLAAVVGPAAAAAEPALQKLAAGKGLLGAGARLAWHRVRGEPVPDPVFAALSKADEDLADLLTDLSEAEGRPAGDWVVPALLEGFAGRLADAAG